MSEEIIYHVFQRSFYDSNGDAHGDFLGLISKLDYIVDLGATSILLLPIYDSHFYHNYFADDFRKIDPSYGSKDDFIELVEAVHERGMKIYLDMEIHYVTEDHLWFKESFQNPESRYSDFVLYNGPNNTDPESIIFDLTSLESHDGVVKKITSINLYNEEVQAAIFDEFHHWIDPFEDGSLRGGVDGYRIDHIMDDLDDKGRITGLLEKFWQPLIESCRRINPEVMFLGEQGNWESYGEKFFAKADVDMMFAFPLKFAIDTFHKEYIVEAIQNLEAYTPASKSQVIFIENHDTTRYATHFENHAGKLRVGAALNLLLKGIPAIYYGQELGVKGAGGFSYYGLTDGNDIPRREAFPWYATVAGEGMAIWYKDSGPWWYDSELRDGDGISVQEQKEDEDSLLNFYIFLIKFRKENEAVHKGDISIVLNGSDTVLSLKRESFGQKLIININLSEQEELLSKLDLGYDESVWTCKFMYPEHSGNEVGMESIKIAPLGIQVFEVAKSS